ERALDCLGKHPPVMEGGESRPVAGSTRAKPDFSSGHRSDARAQVATTGGHYGVVWQSARRETPSTQTRVRAKPQSRGVRPSQSSHLGGPADPGTVSKGAYSMLTNVNA